MRLTKASSTWGSSGTYKLTPAHHSAIRAFHAGLAKTASAHIQCCHAGVLFPSIQ